MGNIIKCPHCGKLLSIDAQIKTEINVQKIDPEKLGEGSE